ncbi:MAG: ABC transporter ATP-binding protein [Thermoleophilaceae bacterium]
MEVASTEAVVKEYGEGRARRRVLDGVDMRVEHGEVVALLGRSGSGKSTLLHLLGGLDRADQGTVMVAGRRLEEESERALTEIRRRHVGFVFQAFHLIPELTGEENVLLPTRVGGNGNGGAARARALVRELGLAEVATRRPKELSGGEQQRLSVARALVNEPDLLLADEPTGNLDPESGHTVLELLRRVAASGRGVLLVTHDVEAAEMADRVLRLENGRLTQ